MSDVTVQPTEADLEARRIANAKASEEAARLAAEHKARDLAMGITDPVQGAILEASKRLKDKLIGEEFSDPATLRPREQDQPEI